MILPVRRLALPGDDRPGNPRRRDGTVKVEILEPDGEDFADAGRGSQHDLDDLTELPITWSNESLCIGPGFPKTAAPPREWAQWELHHAPLRACKAAL